MSLLLYRENADSKLPFLAKKGTSKLPKLATKCHCFPIEKMPTQNWHFWQKKGTSKLPKLATKCHCFSIEKMLAQNCHFWQFCGLKIAKISKIEGATKLPKMAFEHTCTMMHREEHLVHLLAISYSTETLLHNLLLHYYAELCILLESHYHIHHFCDHVLWHMCFLNKKSEPESRE